jgi:hypothetical protein
MNFKSRFFNNTFKQRFKDNFKGFFNIKKDISTLGNKANYFNVFLLNKVHKNNYLMIQNSAFIINAISFLSINNNNISVATSENALGIKLNGILKYNVRIDRC